LFLAINYPYFFLISTLARIFFNYFGTLNSLDLSWSRSVGDFFSFKLKMFID
jgi:hypothetical protein